MKKLFVVSLCVVFIFTLLSVTALAKKNEPRFGIKVGGFTDDGFNEFFWQAGAEMILPIGDNMMIVPEATLFGWKFDFDWFGLHAGGTLDFLFGKPGNQFFAGGGLILEIPIEPDYFDSELMVKFNGGILSKNVKFEGYISTYFDDFFGTLIFGATISFLF